jgi:hypothetical protein
MSDERTEGSFVPKDLTGWTTQARRDDWHMSFVGSDIRCMLAEIERLRNGDERLWCQACNTVTSDKLCDCNRWPAGHEMMREPKLVNYADELAKISHDQALEIERLRAALANANLLLEAPTKDEIKLRAELETAHAEATSLRKAQTNAEERIELVDLNKMITTIGGYGFECEAGPLTNCGDWKYLKKLAANAAQRALAAAEETARADPEWREIAEAPHERGKRLWLWQPGRGGYEGWWEDFLSAPDADWQDDSDSEPAPTHFRALPAPPEVKA